MDQLTRIVYAHSVGQWCDGDLLSQADQEMNETIISDRSGGQPTGEVLSKYSVTTVDGETKDIYVITMLAGIKTYTLACWPEER